MENSKAESENEILMEERPQAEMNFCEQMTSSICRSFYSIFTCQPNVLLPEQKKLADWAKEIKKLRVKICSRTESISMEERISIYTEWIGLNEKTIWSLKKLKLFGFEGEIHPLSKEIEIIKGENEWLRFSKRMCSDWEENKFLRLVKSLCS